MKTDGNWNASVTIRRDDDTYLALDVRCNVTGRYRPAFTQGDPDRCHEAESPEIEPLSAVVEDGSDEGQTFDLATLSKHEDRRLLDALYDVAATEAYDEAQADACDEGRYGRDD